jgi:hypothetical protein
MLRHQLRTVHNIMDLRTFTTDLPRGGMATFAARIGITPIYLSQLAARQDGRLPSPELCVRMEVESERVLRRWHLRPEDWHRIWPELVGAEGAPPIVESETKAA